MKRFLLFLLAIGCVISFAQPVSAQQSTYDERVLTQLYDAQLKRAEPDAYIEKRIIDERAKIRSLAEKDVKTIVDPPSKEGTSSDVVTLPTSINRQRAIVSTLEELLRDRKADIDLLTEEERKYYKNQSTGSGTTDNLKTTKSYPELLAKKAILEERIIAIQSALTLQKDRLNILTSNQSYDQFRKLFSELSYLLVFLFAFVIDKLIRKRIVKRISDKGRRYIVAKVLSTIIYGIAIFFVIGKLLIDHPGSLSSFAIVGAGIAIALQDILKDIVGWMIILQRRLFTLGDRVSVGEHTGDVVDIGLLRTMMLEVSIFGPFNAHERTGKILAVPNSLILTAPVMNYNTTSDFMSAELKVTITYQSDWKEAEKILQRIVSEEMGAFVEQARKQERKRTALFYTSWEVGEPGVHTDLADSGVLFTLKYTVPIGGRRPAATKMSKRILEEFALAKNIHLAYPTIQVEGAK